MEEMDVVFLMDRFGYAKTIDAAAYERNKEAADGESRYVIFCKNTDKIGLFTNQGQMHLLKVSDLPYGKFRDKGQPIDNLSNYSSSEENLIFVSSLMEMRENRLLFVTKTGMLKIVDGKEFDVSKRTTAATKLGGGDEVVQIGMFKEETHLVLQSKKGMFLRMEASSIPEKKKGAVGVRGMKLSAADEISAAYFLMPGESRKVLLKDKELELSRLRVAGRDTKGVKHG